MLCICYVAAIYFIFGRVTVGQEKNQVTWPNEEISEICDANYGFAISRDLIY